MTTQRGFEITGSMKHVMDDWRTVSGPLTARASRDALNRTAQTMSGLIIKRTASALQIKERALRGSRAKGYPRRVFVRRSTARRPRAFVDVLTLPVSREAAGVLHRGARLVSHQGKALANTFVARMESGHVGIYQREKPPRRYGRGKYPGGRPRAKALQRQIDHVRNALPIVEARVPINPTITMIASQLLVTEGPRIFARHFTSRMQYHLQRTRPRAGAG